MLVPTIIMAVLAVILFAFASLQGGTKNIEGLRAGMKILVSTFPMLVFAFMVAGFVQVLLPKDALTAWVGEGSGFKGLMIGTIAGSLTPGGPYVCLPIASALLKSGAGAGTMVAFLTSWSLWAVARLPLEVGILGWRFTLLRLASTLVFPPLAGLLARLLNRLIL